jgi:leucyl-tRNA synthetase
MEEQYKANESENKVQAHWAEHDSFLTTENSDRQKFYCLSMFPYPSGQLHMGHVRNYTLGDVIGRFQRLLGRNVLQPMGWDAFGLPAENAAIKHQVPPAEWTRNNIDNMRRQFNELGYAFDWSREFATCDPEYYRWEQWFFTKLFKKGLVYKKSSLVNWDPVDQTVLANEQVIDGRGWRSDAPVERRELEQWFVKTTAYAEELLEFLDKLPGWPDKVKTMQRNWIGRSEGVKLIFGIPDSSEIIDVYTTRPDTLMGVTYVAVAPQHPLATRAAESNDDIQAFIDSCNQIKVAEADMATMEKLGIDTGLEVIHPITGKMIPVWIGNFVLMEYGSGAVMSVPGHDQRDWEFARKYGLEIVQVIAPKDDSSMGTCDLDVCAFTDKGVLVNSGQFDGLTSEDAFEQIAKALAQQGKGEKQTNYRLRDWGVSRQRYWGCPIPIIYCPDCGSVAVPDEQLPVELPLDVEFDGVGSPLKKMPSFYETSCPECGGPAQRETDTFDTFMESSWYYARFACAHHNDSMLDERADYWSPVDHYVGGEEHAILHLLYARFFHKVMRDEGLVSSDEPFEKLLSLGMVLKDGTKMSKSAGDAGDPQHLMTKYGADAVRMAMMFAAPPEHSFEWSEHGVESAARWLRRLWKLTFAHIEAGPVTDLDTGSLTDQHKELRRVVHETISKAADDYGRRLTFNTVVSSVMKMINAVADFEDQTEQGRAVVREALNAAVIVMSPITPHICHELYKELNDGQLIEDTTWLETDQSALTKRLVELVIQVNGKLRGKIEISPGQDQADVENEARQLPNVSKFIQDKGIRKTIFVQDKLINFVVG